MEIVNAITSLQKNLLKGLNADSVILYMAHQSGGMPDYVIPMDGTYRITAIGSGGLGGSSFYDSANKRVYGGAGGGTGGVAISEYTLKKGDVISNTRTTDTMTVHITGKTDMIVTDGENGETGHSTSYVPLGGAGGTASGGNKHNIQGHNGHEGLYSALSYGTVTWGEGGEGGSYTQEENEICPYLTSRISAFKDGGTKRNPTGLNYVYAGDQWFIGFGGGRGGCAGAYYDSKADIKFSQSVTAAERTLVIEYISS